MHRYAYEEPGQSVAVATLYLRHVFLMSETGFPQRGPKPQIYFELLCYVMFYNALDFIKPFRIP